MTGNNDVFEVSTKEMDLVTSNLDMNDSLSLKDIHKDSYQVEPLPELDTLTLLYLAVLCITTVAGNLGNIMVIGAVFCDKRLWKEGNVFIVNLAIADLCVTAFVDPFSIVGVFVGHQFFVYHDGLCHLIGSVCLISCVCSLWSITAISVNRYILLCKSKWYPRVFTWKNTVLICVALWIGSAFMDLPNFLDWGDHTFDMKTMACSYDRLASYSYTVTFIMMFVTIPLFTVLFCNINIYIVVIRSKIRIAQHKKAMERQQSQTTTVPNETVHYIVLDDESILKEQPKQNKIDEKMAKHSQQPPTTANPVPNAPIASNKVAPAEVNPTNEKLKKKNMSSEVKLAKTLFIIFIVFFICWAPYALICLYDRYDRVPKEAYSVSILMAHSSSTVNSILYAATNRGFRDGYKTFIMKCICKGK